jgi:alpha/beta superfamily hydrolase
LLLFPLLLYASDQAREREYAQQIEDSLVIGDSVELQADGQPFLAIYTEADTDTANAAIVMHGRDVHPNWADVVFPLRSGLAENGWATLSLQMPIGPRDGSFSDSVEMLPQAVPRIAAGIGYLQEQGYTNIVLVAHSFGAQMGTYYLAHGADDGVSAFVSVGLAAAEVGLMKTADFMEKITLPMLDLYGSEDFDNVLSTAWVRAGAQKSNEAYTQFEVEGADHFFSNHDEVLLDTVVQWLQSYKK